MWLLLPSGFVVDLCVATVVIDLFASSLCGYCCHQVLLLLFVWLLSSSCWFVALCLVTVFSKCRLFIIILYFSEIQGSDSPDENKDLFFGLIKGRRRLNQDSIAKLIKVRSYPGQED